MESAGYRLVQEALTNVVKHAGARRVQIRVTDDDEHVETSRRRAAVSAGGAR